MILSKAMSSRSWGAQPISPAACRLARVRAAVIARGSILRDAGEVVVGGDLDLDREPGGQGLGQDRAVDAGVVAADDVEPVGAALILSPLWALTVISRRPSMAG